MQNFFRIITVALLLSAFAAAFPASAAETKTYAVVVSEQTRALAGWADVVKALCRKHDASLVVVTGKLETCEAQLKKLQPRHVCFVAKPEEVTTESVRAIHQLSRRMDDDPFADFMWGIVTGWDAADALRIANTSKPLVIRSAIATTGLNFDLVDSGLSISDSQRGKWIRKENNHMTSGNATNEFSGSTDGLVKEFWEKRDVDLVLTSGHATQVNLEMSWGLGALVCAEGHLYPLNKTDFRKWVYTVSRGTAAGGFWFAAANCVKLRQEWAATTKVAPLKTSTHPKVFFGVGNCLIADTLGIRDSMVTAWLHDGGVDQFVGYTIPTWYGKGGWGTLNLWQSAAGHLSLAEALFLNNQRILWRLQQENPRLLEVSCPNENLQAKENLEAVREVSRAPRDKQRDQLGMVYDRDVVVLYGDPLWNVRFDPARNQDRVSWNWKKLSGGALELKVTARMDYNCDALPLLLPQRMRGAQVLAGQELKPLLNDEFILLPDLKLKKGESVTVKIAPGR